MKKCYQTTRGERGDCFRACVASVLGLRTLDVPDFCNDLPDGDWFGAFQTWCATRYGLMPVGLPHDWNTFEALEAAGVYSIVSGGGMAPGTTHSVVYHGHRLAHDPSGEGLGVFPPYLDVIVFCCADPEVFRAASRRP